MIMQASKLELACIIKTLSDITLASPTEVLEQDITFSVDVPNAAAPACTSP
ncbi:hypothetical protein K443DRAFT_13642 [Laccaria amethystina LaAM-08-1]|uniref:Uncharacterized protein n=1 Tax=Laccaria amethystina LaAM-08-1 TaxID=1095629 RepID=A0A0C9X7L9_9AGAR|nr:hypothetical protein K443DRAFT_13642 [Laccaria amethystina LaAM-08-1]